MSFRFMAGRFRRAAAPATAARIRFPVPQDRFPMSPQPACDDRHELHAQLIAPPHLATLR